MISSWLCGLAPTLPVLLVARVLQGAVAGPLIPLSQAILLGSYPKEKSSMALSLWAMTATVGPIAGPALGGWITDSYSWSWIFYINIPVGLFAAAVTWIIYRKRESATRKAPIDTHRARVARRVGGVACRSCSTRAATSTGSRRR